MNSESILDRILEMSCRFWWSNNNNNDSTFHNCFKGAAGTKQSV
jgi:hypothetical protein